MVDDALEKVAKLKVADKIMFNLATSSNKEEQISTVGKLLEEIGLLNSISDRKETVSIYQQNVSQRLQAYLKETQQEEVNLVFNESVLAHYARADQDDAEIVRALYQDFHSYGLIVLSFVNEVNALRAVKKGEEYRLAFGRIDRKRTQIHNDCLADIKLIERLADYDGIGPFVETKINQPNRTDYGAAIVKLCYRKMIVNIKNLGVLNYEKKIL